ncbi:MAG: hypothetical protein JWM27_2160 [Gemmatimonadetes bacterium]|nr:hypothetical protein [Gemmatimonadota bacterium]
MTSTGRLFMFLAIFGTFVFLVYLTCLWMIRIEENRQTRKQQRVRR